MTTITEALSELNLLKKKIEKKESVLREAIFNVAHAKDPFESEGGSKDYVGRELQAVSDLRRRFVKIRSSISKANLEHKITLGEETRSIYDWLSWKREISEGEISLYKDLYTRTESQINRVKQQPQVYKDENNENKMVSFIFNHDLGTLSKKQESLTETIEKLDGLLSLKNATITIDV